jgi:hypothetical protein
LVHAHARRLLAGLAGLLALHALFGSAIASDHEVDTTRPRVLLLYTESRLVPAVVKVDEAVRTAFAASGINAEFFIEYLDLSWGGDERWAQGLRGFLHAKHGDRTFDVVIPAGAEALRFALAHRAEVFPGSPMVFCAVPPGTVSERDLPPSKRPPGSSPAPGGP